jgi:ATP-dependent DNA ligase
VLYHAGRCLVQEPLARRRDVLAALCQQLDAAEVRFSEAVVGQGRALYAAALAHGHEGVLAKHLTSSYRPGRRSSAWRKIKPHSQRSCSAREVFSYGISGARNEPEIPARELTPRPVNCWVNSFRSGFGSAPR